VSDFFYQCKESWVIHLAVAVMRANQLSSEFFSFLIQAFSRLF